MGLSDARTIAKRLIAGVWTGSDPARDLRRTGGITIGEMATRFLKAVPLAEATKREWGRMARVDFAPINHREAATLRRAEIGEWAGTIAERAGYVGNRAFAMLRRLYSWAVAAGHLEATPFVGLAPPFAGEKKRDRHLTPDELRALLSALDEMATEGGKARRGQHFADGAALLLLTGVRLNSMIEARRSDFVHLDRPDAEWRIRPEHGLKLREKLRATAKPHVVPLSRQAIAVVRRRLEVTNGAEILFPRTQPTRSRGKVTAWWGSSFIRKLRAKMDARLPTPAAKWTVHNFRNTITTQMEEILGVSPLVTDAILGHKATGPSQSHSVYSGAEHMAARRVALQDWADWIDSLRWAPMRRGPRA